jgi:hypothetical protein
MVHSYFGDSLDEVAVFAALLPPEGIGSDKPIAQ